MNTKKDKIPFYIILKESRESEKISLQSISDATKINIKYLTEFFICKIKYFLLKFSKL